MLTCAGCIIDKEQNSDLGRSAWALVGQECDPKELEWNENPRTTVLWETRKVRIITAESCGDTWEEDS